MYTVATGRCRAIFAPDGEPPAPMRLCRLGRGGRRRHSRVANSADPRRLGCSVLSASCGSEALEIIDSKVRVDLVFSDIIMPSMDGLTLLHEVRKRRVQVPIVLATGMTTVLDAATERGAIALVKPYTPRSAQAVFRDQLSAIPRPSAGAN